MKNIAKKPLNQNDICYLIDMTLESKMSWIALASLLKDLFTYDPKQVIDTLLKALERMHLKMLERESDDSLQNVDDTEDVEKERFYKETSIDLNGGTEVALENTGETIENNIETLEVTKESVEEDLPVVNYETIVNENDIEVLEVVKETFDTENHFDLKKRKKHSEVIYDDKDLSENEEHKVDDNAGHELYTFVTIDKASEATTVDSIGVNIQGKEIEDISISGNEKEKFLHCMHCQKQFKNSGHLKIHKRIHTGEVPFECKACKRRFKTKGQLKVHERIHTGEVPYECKTCKERFKHKGSLQSHERIHSGEEPYECKTCKKIFKQKTNLKTHERIHSGEVPYECKMCKKRFNQISALKIHERIHTGEVPFECKTCRKRFKQSPNLKSHERIHSGEMPFKCERCKKRFRNSSNLRQHEKIHRT